MNRTVSAFATLLLSANGTAASVEYEIQIDASVVADKASKAIVYGYIPSDNDHGEIATAEIIGGHATLMGTVEYVRNVSLDLLPADSIYPLGRAEFVLEPGVTRVFFFEDAYEVVGGKYTETAYDSWRRDPVYRALEQEQRAALEAVLALSEEEQKAWRAARREESKKRFKESPGFNAELTKSRILQELYTGHEDPIARFVALGADTGWLLQSEFSEDPRMARARAWLEHIATYEALQLALPGNPAVTFATNRIKDSHQRYLADASISIGTTIKDFGASKMDGNSFHLRNVLQNNQYVLVEFWASWCGPCRAEIPHMKEAYEKYRNNGFEIVSVSLDEEYEDWQEASDEEEIPWIDAGDQMGFDSEAAMLYGVGAIPANFLVKGVDGEIVGKNLREEQLDAKLAELYDELTVSVCVASL